MQAQQGRALVETAGRRKGGAHVQLPEAAIEVGATRADGLDGPQGGLCRLSHGRASSFSVISAARILDSHPWWRLRHNPHHLIMTNCCFFNTEIFSFLCNNASAHAAARLECCSHAIGFREAKKETNHRLCGIYRRD